jgi:U3 small nucleolar RNA-associated protein 10
MLHHCYEILEGTLSLLTPDSLLMVVFGLINHQYPMVRRKVLELFNRKLQYSRDYFEECNKENMLKLLQPFRGIVETVLDETKAGGKEADIIKQNALIAIKLLSKELVADHVDEFKDVLELLTDILKSHAEISPNILASLVLTITELIINLKAHALVFLPKFMPILLNVMKRYDNSNADILVSIVMSIYKIVDALPLFLSPYLTRLLKELCQLFVKVGVDVNSPTDGANKVNIIIANKLKLVWDQLATNIPARIFIPTIDECYQQLIEKKQVAAIGVLMRLLSKGFQHFEPNEFAEYNADIEKLFLSALQFRCDNAGNVSDSVIDEVETCILDAFVSLVLKLSEASFKPLYFKIYDWAIRESASKERAITFYKLSSHVAGALKSLFVLFAPDIIKNAAILLDECNAFEGKDANMVYFTDQPQKNVILIENILNTFYQIFLYDNQHFINKLRFDIVMQPIVDQLHNTLILEDNDIGALLYACVAQLAVAVEDEMLWKQLNDRILLKTRSADKRIRLRGLKCCVELAKKIGTGYQALLPDSVVYLAELLEDDNHEVERSCQKAIQEIEKVVGESLQNYF